MEPKSTFKFYRSFFEAAKALPDKEAQADFLLSICDYSLNGNLPDASGTGYAMFLLVKPVIDANASRSAKRKGNTSETLHSDFDDTCKTLQSDPEDTPSMIDEGCIDDKFPCGNLYGEKVENPPNPPAAKKSTKKRFVPPTAEMVRQYCAERGNDVDAEYFVDYYAARGWKYNGGQPLKDWKAAVRTWERNGHSGSKNSAAPAAPAPRRSARKGLASEDEILKSQQEAVRRMQKFLREHEQEGGNGP